jgi:hypothetical protein
VCDVPDRVQGQGVDGLVGEGLHASVEVDDPGSGLSLGGVPASQRVGVVEGDALVRGGPLAAELSSLRTTAWIAQYSDQPTFDSISTWPRRPGTSGWPTCC